MNNRLKTFITIGIWLSLSIFFLSSCGGSSSPKKEEPAPVPIPTELMTLAVTGETISPAFSNNVSDYTLSVENDTSSITIEATAAAGLSITVNSQAFTTSQAFDLVVGDNVFVIQVSNATETRGYNLTISRADPPGTVVGRAILGPISLGLFELYSREDLINSIYATQTTGGNGLTIDQIGLINLGAITLTDTNIYIATISAGDDVDADDDGILDATPTPLQGTIHAILTGSQLKAGNWQVTLMSELVYQEVKYILTSGASNAEILMAIDNVSQQLLANDINGDGTINGDDIVSWDPVINKNDTNLYPDQLSNILNSLHAGTAVTTTSRKRSFIANISTLDIGIAHDIKIDGQIAYIVAMDGCSLFAYDISNPQIPILKAKYDVPDNVEDPSDPYCDLMNTLEIEGDYIYITGSGFWILDKTVFLSATGASAAVLERNYRDVGDNGFDFGHLSCYTSQCMKVEGNYVYLTSRGGNSLSGGFVVIDVSDPTRFMPVSTMIPTNANSPVFEGFKGSLIFTTQTLSCSVNVK